MKRILSLTLAILILTVSLTACKKSDNTDSGQTPDSIEPTPPAKIYFQHPLTGEEKTSDYPTEKSPVAIMVNNIMSNTTQNAWPHAGLSDADVIYEMETEGGITRYMAVYSDYTKVPKVGPVRSARDQFVQLMIPLQALYVHVGGSDYAKNMLSTYGWADRDIDGYIKSITFLDRERLATRAREHCSFTDGATITKIIEKDKLSDENAEKLLFNWVKYDEPVRVPQEGDASSLYIRYSQIYDGTFTYNPTKKTYTKEHRYIPENYQKPMIDINKQDAPVEFDNVFVLWTQIERYPDSNSPNGKSTLSKVDMDFGGVGYYFTQGKFEKVRWMKGIPTNSLRVTDASGHEIDIEVNTGKTYVSFVDLDYFGAFEINDKVVDTAGDYTSNEDIPVEGDNQEAAD